MIENGDALADRRLGLLARLPDKDHLVQGGGFFTAISSNGTQNAVIWAVARPIDSEPAEITLYAYDPLAAVTSGPSWLLSIPAGTWPNIPNAYPNIVPVVANGFVYVASYQQLAIFGLA
jgi:hypothetical protein